MAEGGRVKGGVCVCHGRAATAPTTTLLGRALCVQQLEEGAQPAPPFLFASGSAACQPRDSPPHPATTTNEVPTTHRSGVCASVARRPACSLLRTGGGAPPPAPFACAHLPPPHPPMETRRPRVSDRGALLRGGERLAAPARVQRSISSSLPAGSASPQPPLSGMRWWGAPPTRFVAAVDTRAAQRRGPVPLAPSPSPPPPPSPPLPFPPFPPPPPLLRSPPTSLFLLPSLNHLGAYHALIPTPPRSLVRVVLNVPSLPPSSSQPLSCGPVHSRGGGGGPHLQRWRQ